MADRELTRAELRHLLRRLAFAATPELEARTSSLDATAALEVLWADGGSASSASQPEFLSRPWTNTALAYTGTPVAARDAARSAQLALHRLQTEQLRQAWLTQMAHEPALRENLTLFLHSFFGSSSEAVEIPHALQARNALLARTCMTSVPEILEGLVLDPAMLIQIGMDGHGPDRVSDRPAKLILEQWTVGAGNYSDADVGELSRALTGWTLGSTTVALAGALDPAATPGARRTGLEPRFDAARFERGPKTILGVTRDFDAQSALLFLAMQPAAAHRFGGELLRHLGVADPDGALRTRLAKVYLASGGSVRELLRTIVGAPEFWTDNTRWALIKSPAHLAIGAWRQLALAQPPAAALSAWLAACGQSLFDTPSNGERSWADQEAWLAPADRLALRYQLPHVLAGATAPRLPTLDSAAAVAERLDPAPGFAEPAGRRNTWAAVEQIMATPHYQLA